MRTLLSALVIFSAFPATASAATQKREESYVSCYSGVSAPYSDVGKIVYWSTYVKISEIERFHGQSEKNPVSIAREHFYAWAIETGQYGRWNSILSSCIKCDGITTSEYYRYSAPQPDTADKVFRDASLPDDWYARMPGDKSLSSKLERELDGTRAVDHDVATGVASSSSEKSDDRIAATEELARKKREAHEAVLARNAAAEAEYQAKLKARDDQIARNAQIAAANERAKAEGLKRAAERAEEHERRMAETRRASAEFEALKARHAKCVAGDAAACAAMEAGEPVDPEKEEASTDIDARMCVTEPVISANETFAGSMTAVVINGCDKPVDVRLCLLRAGGWNCGMTNGLPPQSQWSHWSYETQGEVFWDARTSGSRRELGQP